MKMTFDKYQKDLIILSLMGWGGVERGEVIN
jgi:hypothetical protein